MRLPNQLLSSLLVLCAASLGVAATWGFEDATVSVNKRGAGVGGGFKEKYGLSFSQALSDTQTDHNIQDRTKQSFVEACHSRSIRDPQDPPDNQRGQQSQKAASSIPSGPRSPEQIRHILRISGQREWEGQD